MKRLAACLLFAAACSHHAAATMTTTPPPANHGGVPPVVTGPYAAMFVAGTQWTYTLSQNTKPPTTATMTCKVASVTPGNGETAATITCDRFLDEGTLDNPLAGDWIADAKGLWLAASPRELVMPHDPAPSDTPSYDRSSPEGANGDVTGDVAIKQDGDRWCWGESSSLGDVNWRSLCFASGAVASGEAGFQSDAAEVVTFTRIPEGE